jgi:NitT/TauT family transport system substrate-binding protein
MLKKLGIAAAFLVMGMGGASADPVKLGLQPWLGYGPLWVAEEKGFFDKHGVDVELTNFNWDQDMVAAVASGNLHVIAAATNTTISSINAGVDVKGFLILDLSAEADAILVTKDVQSIADLKGKKVAFESGATSDLLINYALKHNGMSITDIEHVPMGASEAGLALISGQVQAAVTYEPYISAALKQGDGHKIIYTAAEKPGLISDLLIASPAWLQEHSKEAEGIIRAWDEAINFIRANPAEGEAMIAKAVGSPMEEFEPAFKGVRLYNAAENKQILGDEFQASVAEIGAIMQAAKPDEIKMIPTPEQLLWLDALNKVAQ